MTIIEDTLRTIVETWDDPGDYPSGAGGGPLASYDFIAEVEGHVLITLEEGESIEDVLENEMPRDFEGFRVTSWKYTALTGRKYIVSVEEFE